MPVNPDVMKVVRILDEEGFGALAGELLMEISLGRELDLDKRFGMQAVDFDTAANDGALLEARPKREPIPDDQQLGEAMEFLRLRLVEPVRRLAEAERIAQQLLTGTLETPDQEISTRTSEIATKITFIETESSVVSGFVRTEQAGQEESADWLDSILTRIAEQAI